MQMLLPSRLRARYLASTWEEIVERIVGGPIVKTHPHFPATQKLQADVRELLTTQTFVPAGNTLAFGARHESHTAEKLQPNCSIVDDVNEGRAEYLWERGIGVGTTMDEDSNPVPRILQLQTMWNSMKAQHRPMRGNMFVYPATGRYIHDFINLKATVAQADAVPGFNISVAVNSFDELPEDVLDAIANAAWATGDPGIVFMNRVNANVPLRHATKTIKTLVPCGEQGMFDGEFCTLGSINLNSRTIANPITGELCPLRFDHAVRTAVTFLDNAVDVCAESGGRNYRRVGLGVMGWADYLARLGVRYDSEDAQRLATQISCTFGAIARHQSAHLATYRGPFPRFYNEDFFPNSSFLEQDALMGYPRTSLLRNVSVTCLAPTGGITLVTKNRGFAIEPFFHETTTVSVAGHISMANAWQQGVCNSVSKTINFPECATVADFKTTILEAYKTKHLKALSMYRANSRLAQPIATQ